jgi:H+/gluconate symporter-like permease
MYYLERQRLNAKANNEHFVAGENDRIPSSDSRDLPKVLLAVLPLATVLFIIIAPRIFTSFAAADSESWGRSLLYFANTQPIVWPSIALFIGSLLSVLLFSNVRNNALIVLGGGTHDAIMPLINTAVVIGFGGVVTHTNGFSEFTGLVLDSELPPLISSFLSISLVSAITGSASGGLQIFMHTMAPAYIEMGLKPEVLHRVATMASGGFDSLPHCGAIIAMLTITGLSHREAYRDVGVITVVIPVVATLTSIVAATLFY